jgi:hypothetical protein
MAGSSLLWLETAKEDNITLIGFTAAAFPTTMELAARRAEGVGMDTSAKAFMRPMIIRKPTLVEVKGKLVALLRVIRED